MLRKMDRSGRFENFLLPFDGKLKKDNRWVKLADAIPWDYLEEIYGKKFSPKMGRPGLNARIAIGALIIKHRQNLTDEETVEQIMENPYLQYFLGYEEFQDKLIDELHEGCGRSGKKPRAYRKNARRDYLRVSLLMKNRNNGSPNSTESPLKENSAMRNGDFRSTESWRNGSVYKFVMV